MKRNEVAKFVCGFAAAQVLTHGGLAIGGIRFELFGIRYARAFNTVAAIVWSIVSIILAYFAWSRNGSGA